MKWGIVWWWWWSITKGYCNKSLLYPNLWISCKTFSLPQLEIDRRSIPSAVRIMARNNWLAREYFMDKCNRKRVDLQCVEVWSLRFSLMVNLSVPVALFHFTFMHQAGILFYFATFGWILPRLVIREVTEFCRWTRRILCLLLSTFFIHLLVLHEPNPCCGDEASAKALTIFVVLFWTATALWRLMELKLPFHINTPCDG